MAGRELCDDECADRATRRRQRPSGRAHRRQNRLRERRRDSDIPTPWAASELPEARRLVARDRLDARRHGDRTAQRGGPRRLRLSSNRGRPAPRAGGERRGGDLVLDGGRSAGTRCGRGDEGDVRGGRAWGRPSVQRLRPSAEGGHHPSPTARRRHGAFVPVPADARRRHAGCRSGERAHLVRRCLGQGVRHGPRRQDGRFRSERAHRREPFCAGVRDARARGRQARLGRHARPCMAPIARAPVPRLRRPDHRDQRVWRDSARGGRIRVQRVADHDVQRREPVELHIGHVCRPSRLLRRGHGRELRVPLLRHVVPERKADSRRVMEWPLGLELLRVDADPVPDLADLG